MLVLLESTNMGSVDESCSECCQQPFEEQVSGERAGRKWSSGHGRRINKHDSAYSPLWFITNGENANKLSASWGLMGKRKELKHKSFCWGNWQHTQHHTRISFFLKKVFGRNMWFIRGGRSTQIVVLQKNWLVTDLVLCYWIVITDASMCMQPVGGCY